MPDTDPRQRSLLHVLQANALARPDAPALREKARGIWHETSWAAYHEQVQQCAAGLRAHGFEAGDGLLVLGDNGARLYAGMLAAALLRGYAVPAFPDAGPQELRQFAREVRLRAVLVSDQEQADKAIALRQAGCDTGIIVYDDPRGMRHYDEPDMLDWCSLLADGAAALAADPGLGQRLLDAVQPDDPAVLVHSSGTTGRPKGILLSHRNVLFVGHACLKADMLAPGCEILAYLPMAWIGDFEISVVAGMLACCVLDIPESQETVLRDLREVAPSFYLATPRSWENLLTRIQVAMEDATPLKRRIYRLFLDRVMEDERRALAGTPPGPGAAVLRWLGEQLVFGPIKDRFGLSRVTHAWTGGEAIGEDTFLFYRALGLRLRQLYGQSELSAFATLQSDQEVRLHTVGRALEGVELRISDEGEVLVRSPGVFDGYLPVDGVPAAQPLRDGWLHTGDAGTLEPDGQLVILGRHADLVCTAAGERYVPTSIENRLKFSPYVKDAAVVGAGRPFLSALVCIDFGSVGHWAQMNGVAYVSYADLAQNPRVQTLVAEAVERANRSLPPGLRLRRFVCLPKEFDADDGEITRTRKLRRGTVEALYAPVIEALYAGAAEVVMTAHVTYESGAVGRMERRLVLNGA